MERRDVEHSPCMLMGKQLVASNVQEVGIAVMVIEQALSGAARYQRNYFPRCLFHQQEQGGLHRCALEPNLK